MILQWNNLVMFFKKHSWLFNDQHFDLKYLTLHSNFTHQDCDSTFLKIAEKPLDVKSQSCGMLYINENISTSKGWKIWVQTAADCFTGDRFPSRGLGLIFNTSIWKCSVSAALCPAMRLTLWQTWSLRGHLGVTFTVQEELELYI